MEKGSLKSTGFLTKIQLSQVKNNYNKRSSVKIMKKFLSDKLEEQQFQKMQNKEYNKSIENLLIDELHKSMSPFFDSVNTNVLNQIRQKRMSAYITEITPISRNVDVCFL